VSVARAPAFAAAAALAAAIVVGSLVDPVLQRPPLYRAGYRVLEADLHAHTRFSDGLLSPFSVVLQARRRGLDVVAITEHNMILPGELARGFSRLVGGPVVLVGEEVTTDRFHVIGVGLRERVDASQSLSAVLDDIHDQGGVAIAAHPVERFWPAFDAVRDELDAAEVMHPLAYARGEGGGWRWDEMRDFYERARAEGATLAAVGSSDYHFFSPLGLCRTYVFVEQRGEAGVLDALRDGRTVVRDREGRTYGEARLAEALERRPYGALDPDYGYAGTGLADRVARVVGLAALLGLVFLRRR
jgi:hypothetical protein